MLKRVENWVAQLKDEGFLEGSDNDSTAAAASSTVVDEPASVVSPEIFDTMSSHDDADLLKIALLEEKNAVLQQKLEEYSHLLDATIETHSDNGYEAHYNPKPKSTMWTSTADGGRTCYYTTTATTTSSAISP